MNAQWQGFMEMHGIGHGNVLLYGVVDGGSPCRLSIIENGKVSMSLWRF